MSGCGVPCLLPPGLGSEGRGQTESMSSMGQNGRICSYRYHWLSALNSRGGTIFGSSSGSGVQGSFSSCCLTSGVSHCTFVKILPGELEVILK